MGDGGPTTSRTKRLRTWLSGGKKNWTVPPEPPAQYLVYHSNGSQSELAHKDTVYMYSDGLLVNHNDPAGTTTFYPFENIVWIRCYNVKR